MTTNLIQRSIVLGLSSFCFLIFGCTQGTGPSNSTVSQLSGSWRWVQSVGGIFPRVVTPPSGTVVEDSFTPDGAFSRVVNDTTVVTATYFLTDENNGPFIRYTNVQTYHGYTFEGSGESIQVENDTLRLTENVTDGFQHTYVRAIP
jgi:hypothetical protein